MAEVKIDIAEDQERCADRVMVSGGEGGEGIVLKDTMEGGLIEACKRAEKHTQYSSYNTIVLGRGVIPLLREHLGLPAVAEEDDE